MQQSATAHDHQSAHMHRAFLTALTAMDGVGARTVRQVVAACQQQGISLAEFWHQPRRFRSNLSQVVTERLVAAISEFKHRHDPLDNLEQILAAGYQLLTYSDAAYPKLLLATDDFPAVLFVRSRLQVTEPAWQQLWQRPLAVVGTRQMTAYGRLVLQELIPPLARSGQTIVSGFMYGVDLQAGQLALATGGQTVAVLGYGFEHCFPRRQQAELTEFLAAGAVFVSEFPPSVPPKASHFVMRNRIVAGLAQATLVVEAASRSGSHITANFANDYGRLVLAVPGPITNPFSNGTKDLVNQGATLVTSASDILQEITQAWHLEPSPHPVDAELTESSAANSSVVKQNTAAETSAASSEQTVLTSLRTAGPLSLSELSQHCQLSLPQLNQLLFDLELQGRISKQFGNYCLKL